MAYLLEQLRVLIEQLILTLGYPGIALIMFAENLFPPIPSEVVLPFAGSLVQSGELNLVGVLLSSTLGATLGTGLFYYLGGRLGEARSRSLIRRYGSWLALDEGDLERSLTLFRRRERSIIFFGRFLPGVRTLISLPAGIARMRLGTFLLYTVLGTLAWNALLVGAGVILGAQWERILNVIDRFETFFWLAVALLLGYFIVTRVQKLRQSRA
jgi:membrane protein DedA with SNARE-associated domain